MRVLVSKEMRFWFLANIFLPIAIPVCLVLVLNIAVRLDAGFLCIIKMLWQGGLSIFWGLFALLSLLPLGTSKLDGKFATAYLTAYFILIMPMFFATCLLYWSYLSLVPEGADFSQNIEILTAVTVICVIAAIIDII